MNSYSLSHLSDHVLLQSLTVLVSQDRATTATLLAHLAEMDHRKLYRPAAYESMYLYCVHELRMCEDTAYRRIRVARTARKFPAIFPALADGRLNMTAVLLLTPHLTSQNADELLAAARHRTKAEIDLLIAERFPLPDLPTLVQAIAPAVGMNAPGAQRVVPSVESIPRVCVEPLAPEPVVPSAGSRMPSQMEPLPQRAKLAPLSPGRFAWQVTVDQETQDQMRYAQALLGHAVPSGDVAQVLKRAMNALVRELERDKFAKSARSRPSRGTDDPRYVPADVRRTVWQRDGGQCTFVSEHGKRCEARKRLEYDHIETVARGGRATVKSIRLRCRAHNQYTAECTFGAGFMAGKREHARDRAMRAKKNSSARQLPTNSAAPSPATPAWPGAS